jgi:hypothetical protein
LTVSHDECGMNLKPASTSAIWVRVMSALKEQWRAA